MDLQQESIKLHEHHKGKLEISSRVSINNITQLSLAYSPGVAGPCREIEQNPQRYKDLTSAGNTVAVISDGSAVLGMGNIGPKPAMPVMEGKSVLLKQFAGLNSVPIVLDSQDTEIIVQTIKQIAPSFAAINLEDIQAPRCFEIEERLKRELDIPVMHDDQHGTAIVVLAGLINALKVTGRTDMDELRIVINGAGAAGVACAKLLREYGFTKIVMCDSSGIISPKRDDLNPVKQTLLELTNPQAVHGSLIDALNGADVFIGVSQANLLGEEEILVMRDDPIVFALANPDPEIDPKMAAEYGVAVLATGRSDVPNQVNNVLAFPGIFKGALEAGVSEITEEMKLGAARALADMVGEVTAEKIIPGPFEEQVVQEVARVVTELGTQQSTA